MKITLLFLISLLSIYGFSQKITKEDPSYMMIDNDLLGRYLQEELNPFSNISLSDGTIAQNAKLIPLQFTSALPVKEISLWNKLELFGLDTNLANASSYWKVYQNSKYLELSFTSANDLGKESRIMGFIKKEFISEKPNWEELVKLLMYVGVIRTYDHLNAELVRTKKSNTAKSFYIQYDVVWHYCTNDCYDPEYTFGIEIDKKTGRLTLVGK